MTDTTISTENEVMTLINVFTVEPERQRQLVALLVEATDAVMTNMPGFISANIHRSADGTRVVNYAQWRSAADFAAMRSHPSAIPHLHEAGALAQFDPSSARSCTLDTPDTRLPTTNGQCHAGVNRPGSTGRGQPAGVNRPGSTGSGQPARVNRLGSTGSGQPAGCQPSAGPSFVAMSVRICT